MICTGLGGLWFILGARGYLDRFHCSIIHTHTHTHLCSILDRKDGVRYK